MSGGPGPGFGPGFGQARPREEPGAVPKTPRAAAVNLDAVAAQPEMRAKISAYPGNVTFVDLIEKNRRQSIVLMVCMLALAVVVGGVMAAAISAYGGGVATFEQLLPSVLLGGVAALLFGGIGAVWSWYGGAAAILSMSGAKPITRADDLELHNVVEELSIAAGLPMPRVFLIPETALNAFATGRDPAHAAVAITTGLRSRLTRDELQGVLAHEMAHVRHYDIRFSMLMATMVGLIVFACDAFWRILRYGRLGGGRRGSSKDGAGAVMAVVFIVALLLSLIAPIIAQIIQMTYSREREYLADAGAIELTRNPQGLASALQKLAGDEDPLVDAANRGTAHLFIVNPLRKMRQAHQSLNTMFSSHPPIQDRIARLLALTR